MSSTSKPNAARRPAASWQTRVAPSTDARLGAHLRAVAIGCTTGIIMSLVAVSYAALLYAGRLAPLSGLGIEIALAGTLFFAIGAAILNGDQGIFWQLQSATIAPIAVAMFALLNTEPGLHGLSLYATALAMVACATLLCGVLLFTCGALRLGELARFIPYPVLTGFLASTGLVLVINGIELGANVPPRGVTGMIDVLISLSPLRWGPPIAMALVLIVLAQRFRWSFTLLLGLTVYLALFYGLTLALDGSMHTIQQQGLLFASRLPQAGHRLFNTPIVALEAVNTTALVAQLPQILVVPALALFTATLNVAGLNLAAREELDLNRALRRAGLFNMLAGCMASPPGFHSPTVTQLVASQIQRPSRLTGLSAAAAVGLVLALGVPLVRWLPAGLFGVILMYLSGSIVIRWLWQPLRRMQATDIAITLLIVATTLGLGFVPAVLLGLLVAALMFVIAYARIEVVRTVTTARLRRSTTERSESAVRRLAACGDSVRILELQGYLFFGSTRHLSDQLAPPKTSNKTTYRWVVLDFRRVHGLDISTALLLARTFRSLSMQDVRVAVTGTESAVEGALSRADAFDHAENFASLDDALTDIENRLLENVAHDDERTARPFSAILERLLASPAATMLDQRRLAAGDVLMTAGDHADGIAYLEAGRLSASHEQMASKGLYVARFLPGAIIGEIGFLTGQPRTATIRADTESCVVLISRAAMDYLDTHEPTLARALIGGISQLLAERLSRTTALAHALL